MSSNSISESEWVEYYKSLLDNNSSDLTRAEPTLGTAQTPSPLDFPFNCSEIKKGIKRLKNSKKEGTDLILNEFLKTGNSTLILTLVKLFNKILKSGKFPKLWNHSLFPPFINLEIQMTVITIGVSVLLAALVNSLPPCYKKA